MNIEDRLGALAASAIFDSYNSALRKIFEEMYEQRTVRLYATMDELVCEICHDLNGTKFDISETNDVLPIHPYCRCFFVQGDVE